MKRKYYMYKVSSTLSYKFDLTSMGFTLSTSKREYLLYNKENTLVGVFHEEHDLYAYLNAFSDGMNYVTNYKGDNNA